MAAARTPATTPPAIAPVLFDDFVVTVLVTAADGPETVWEAVSAAAAFVEVLCVAAVVAAAAVLCFVLVDDGDDDGMDDDEAAAESRE